MGKPKDTGLYAVSHDFGEVYARGYVGAHYYRDDNLGVSGVAIDPKAPSGVREGYRIEAEGYERKRPPKSGRRTMLHSSDIEDLDPEAILAIRSVIEDIAPGWVEEIREAARISNNPRVIAGYCEISLPVVVAALDNLRLRGELPEDEEWAV